MPIELEQILLEKDSGAYSGDLGQKYSSFISKYSKENRFLVEIKSKLIEAIASSNFPRFNFLVYLLATYGNNLPTQKDIYVLLMDFIIQNIGTERRDFPEVEEAITDTLDLFWHQDKALQNLNKEEQIKLNKVLENASQFKYDITENGDEVFFSINKSVDLIKHQGELGNSEALINLYINHFDPKIRETAKEYKGNTL